MLPNDISGYKLYENSWPSLCPWGFTNLKYHWIVKLGAWKETNGQITREEYSPFHVHSHFSTREPFWILYLGYTYFWFNPTRPILVPFGLKTLLIFYKISDEHDNYENEPAQDFKWVENKDCCLQNVMRNISKIYIFTKQSYSQMVAL